MAFPPCDGMRPVASGTRPAWRYRTDYAQGLLSFFATKFSKSVFGITSTHILGTRIELHDQIRILYQAAMPL